VAVSQLVGVFKAAAHELSHWLSMGSTKYGVSNKKQTSGVLSQLYELIQLVYHLHSLSSSLDIV